MYGFGQKILPKELLREGMMMIYTIQAIRIKMSSKRERNEEKTLQPIPRTGNCVLMRLPRIHGSSCILSFTINREVKMTSKHDSERIRDRLSKIWIWRVDSNLQRHVERERERSQKDKWEGRSERAPQLFPRRPPRFLRSIWARKTFWRSLNDAPFLLRT
jgi:hypothetical protein